MRGPPSALHIISESDNSRKQTAKAVDSKYTASSFRETRKDRRERGPPAGPRGLKSYVFSAF